MSAGTENACSSSQVVVTILSTTATIFCQFQAQASRGTAERTQRTDSPPPWVSFPTAAATTPVRAVVPSLAQATKMAMLHRASLIRVEAEGGCAPGRTASLLKELARWGAGREHSNNGAGTSEPRYIELFFIFHSVDAGLPSSHSHAHPH